MIKNIPDPGLMQIIKDISDEIEKKQKQINIK